MSRRLPHALLALFDLGERVAAGLNAQQDALHVKQNRADDFRATLDQACAADGAFNHERAAALALTAEVQSASSAAETYIVLARDILKPTLGRRWSEAWAGTGFRAGSLTVSRAPDIRQDHVRKVGSFFALHPSREVPALELTAEQAAALHDRLAQARSAVNAHSGVLARSKERRDAAVAALRRRLRGTLAELDQLLPADDPRWRGFGLTPPAVRATPPVPQGLVLRPGPAGSGTVYLNWDDTRRAERYRVWRQLPREAAPVAVATVTDSETALHAQPLHALLAFAISAANATGESAAGERREITLA